MRGEYSVAFIHIVRGKKAMRYYHLLYSVWRSTCESTSSMRAGEKGCRVRDMLLMRGEALNDFENLLPETRNMVIVVNSLGTSFSYG